MQEAKRDLERERARANAAEMSVDAAVAKAADDAAAPPGGARRRGGDARGGRGEAPLRSRSGEERLRVRVPAYAPRRRCRAKHEATRGRLGN